MRATGVFLEEAAIKYAEATAEVRRLTSKLADCDEDGPALICSTPVVDERTHAHTACRKWTYERPNHEDAGVGGWVSARDFDDWCDGCRAIQKIVNERRAAKKKRSAALTAIGNIARGIMRRAARPGSSEAPEREGSEDD